jgi:hypothetical protein
MVSLDTFQRIQTKYGHYVSWALWADEGSKPKDNIDDLTVLDPQANPALLGSLRGDFIFLGLNISRRIERALGNFHDPRPMATDFKIRYALKETPYWGSYMTDIIKDFEEKASGKMMKYLSSDREFEKENIQILRSEILDLKVISPTLIVFGRDAEVIAKRNLGQEFRICRIPHYANYISKEEYRVKVTNILDKQLTEQSSGGNA